MQKFDVIIIGLGPAGAAAAIYSSRAGLSSVIFEGNAPGGQLSLTDKIENYPGTGAIEGWKLAMELVSQVEACGAKIIYERITKVELDSKIVETASGRFEGRTIIIAGGSKRRELGLDGEKKLVGKGISYCAVCDGGFYKDKTVAVVGGGETAVSDALYLSKICKKVWLCHRRDSLRASKSKQILLDKCENVQLLLSVNIAELQFDTKLNGIRLDSGLEIPLDGLFVAIGSDPDTSLYSGLALENGFILTDESMATSIAGVYAAGDIRKKQVRQIVTAASDGAIAAISAAEFLEKERVNDTN